MKKRSRWITTAAAVAALVGGLGGVARATVLSAGGFPGSNFNTGVASCVVSNMGIRDVVVTSVSLFDIAGTPVGNPVNGAIVHPGQTREVVYASTGVYGIPASCSFDLTTKSGVRAAFVYTSGFNGSTVVVIPAQK